MMLMQSILVTQVESPQLRKATPAGRSKSFSNHRPLDHEVFSPVEPSSQVQIRKPSQKTLTFIFNLKVQAEDYFLRQFCGLWCLPSSLFLCASSGCCRTWRLQ